ncbi:cupin domain-containing protein [Lentzea sp. CA-135723]|uniref:cupin domain-containing protein n=1 Tax=Lentzea sp. CA-135723 TaxID=3239950 RepID=UPI003D927ED2
MSAHPQVEILAEAPATTPVPEGLIGRTVLVTLPPGSPGAPPHRHPGPVYGYVVEGAILFQLEGQPERTLKAGEAFFEPGGDVIHLKGANLLADEESALIATMICEPGAPVLTLVSAEELGAGA